MATTPINEVNPFAPYVAAPGATEFSGNWWIGSVDDVIVYKNGVALVSGYSISGVQETAGFLVTFDTPLAGGEAIILAGDFDISRLTGYTTGGSFRAESLNLELSTHIAIMNQLNRDISRKLGIAITSTINTANLLLPTPADGRALVWDGSAGLLRNSTVNLDGLEAAVQSALDAAADAQEAADFAEEQANNTITIPGNSIITPAGADGTALTLAQLLSLSYFMPEMFLDGTYTDRQRVDACCTAAETLGKAWKLQPGKAYAMGNTQFTRDPTKAILSCDGYAELQFSAMPVEGWCVRLATTLTSGTSYAQFPKYAQQDMHGVAIKGGGQFSQFVGTGLQIGDGTYIFCQFDLFCYIQGFTITRKYMNNTWRIGFHGSERWGKAIGFVNGVTPTNAGEQMRVYGMLGDTQGNDTEYNYGNWSIQPGTSMDNAPIIVRNDAFVRVEPAHVENPGASSTTQRYATIEGEASLVYNGLALVHNTPSGGAATRPLFLNNGGVPGGVANGDIGATGGMFFNDMQMVNWSTSNYDTRASYTHNLLVEGAGFTEVRALKLLSAGNGQNILISRAMQALANGLFNNDTLGAAPANWTKTDESGGGGTGSRIYEVSNTYVTGDSTKALKMSATRTSGGSYGMTVASDMIPVGQRDWFMHSTNIIRDFTTGTGTGSFTRSVRCFNAAGGLISSKNGIANTTDTPSITAYAPAAGAHFQVPVGCVAVQIVYNLTVTAGTVTCYVCDVLTNVCKS